VPLRGDLLSRPTYTFLQTMYEGNSGVCYKCQHEVFGEPFVQKTISLVGLDDALAYQEPQLLHSIQHPNIVEIREAQWEPDERWAGLQAVTFTMPYYPGGSVDTALGEGYQFPLSSTVGVVAGVLAALHYLHVTRRVLHRDIKPGNVMLDALRQHAYLGDLGSAAPLTDDGTAEARSGTLFHRPPEYAAGSLSVSSDLYSLGLTMFEMINGVFPYDKLDHSEIERRIGRGWRSMPDHSFALPPYVPARLGRFVRQLIAKDPLHRPISAENARRTLLRIPFIDWLGEANIQSGWAYHGAWAPRGPATARSYRAVARPLHSGPDRGLLALEASWSDARSSQWRRMRTLDRRVQADDATGLRAFFADIEAAAAQQVAAR
jgi:eukaryotic-like serine/threonine-protein kinase